jgi:pimeloyl-ACP methyl ester carboxylesterase
VSVHTRTLSARSDRISDSACTGSEDRAGSVCRSRSGPLSVSALTGVAGARPAWHDKPCWALIAEQDNAIPLAGQHWMANRAGTTLGTVAASHAVTVSQPGAVTQTVLEAVESV